MKKFLFFCLLITMIGIYFGHKASAQYYTNNSQNDGFITYEGNLVGNYNFDQNYIIEGNVHGNITILSGVTVIIEGNNTGNTTLQAGSMLTIEGNKVGNITLGQNSRLVIHGKMIGNMMKYQGSTHYIGEKHIGNISY